MYTSGLADPGPIASMFWLDDGLGSELYLDGIVAVVDAKHIREVNTDAVKVPLQQHDILTFRGNIF